MTAKTEHPDNDQPKADTPTKTAADNQPTTIIKGTRYPPE